MNVYVFKRGNTPSIGHYKLGPDNESIDFDSYNGFFNRDYTCSSPKGFKVRGVFNG